MASRDLGNKLLKLLGGVNSRDLLGDGGETRHHCQNTRQEGAMLSFIFPRLAV